MRKIIVLSALVSLVVLSACNSQYKKADNLATLNVSFADSAWDGKTVPKDQICQWAGGNGSSPQLTVSNIPAGANAVIVEFSECGHLIEVVIAEVSTEGLRTSNLSNVLIRRVCI